MEELDMSANMVDQLKDDTINSLIDPNGIVKLAYLEVVPVQCVVHTKKNGLLWYLEEEKSFIVEESEVEEFSFLTFKSVDDLINNHWVIVKN